MAAGDRGMARCRLGERFDERSYFSVFLVAQHTLVAEIFVAHKGVFPLTCPQIATIRIGIPVMRPDFDNYSDAGRHEGRQDDRTEKERLHVGPPLTSWSRARN
jgi:hypothetical protein